VTSRRGLAARWSCRARIGWYTGTSETIRHPRAHGVPTIANCFRGDIEQW
jgi:hypothetical protein